MCFHDLYNFFKWYMLVYDKLILRRTLEWLRITSYPPVCAMLPQVMCSKLAGSRVSGLPASPGVTTMLTLDLGFSSEEASSQRVTNICAEYGDRRVQKCRLWRRFGV
jgi:hypothetical protein